MTGPGVPFIGPPCFSMKKAPRGAEALLDDVAVGAYIRDGEGNLVM